MILAEIISPYARFSRSINVERDSGRAAVETYLPTGRALDVVRRVSRGLSGGGAGRAFSITGPHGSGKSSLAVFLASLAAPEHTAEYDSAMEALGAAEPDTAQHLLSARCQVGSHERGFIRAVVTANREPVAATVARALEVGARRFFPTEKTNPVPASWSNPDIAAKLSPRQLREKLEALTAQAPVLLVIDEFGKNLEAYADSGRDGDPYLLQQLAEWADGDLPGPLLILTMQHLAFEEYVHETSTARRREWVKVQGRFEDIAYVETASQARRLVAAAFRRDPGPLDQAVTRWSKQQLSAYVAAGLRDLFDDDVVSRAYPIHPVALAALPELCARYGQNERTLFSFLAGPEPHAVPAYLTKWSWRGSRPLPFVRLADVYDYFVASAATMIGSAASGGRWVEIESRIRDTSGLEQLELQVLKTIGVLNLISAGGTLRASRSILALAISDDPDPAAVADALHVLERRGLVTYRDFADEYRIWQGSDFDLSGTVDTARRRCASRRLDELLNEAAPPTALVASRHSQQHGTLRVFERRFSSFAPDDLVPPAPESEWDGRILLAVTEEVPWIEAQRSDKPLIAVVPESVDELRDDAIDTAALAGALKSAESANADWVARRELIERFSAAQQRLQERVDAVFEAQKTSWHLLGTDRVLEAIQGPSRVLSDLADQVFSAAPEVPNEMIARRELTSQGAKARRLLIEAMLSRPQTPRLGIDGFPAERAMYEAVLRRAGIHVDGADGVAKFQPPTDRRYQGVWGVIEGAFDRAVAERLDITAIWRSLQAPPIGLKDGPIPVLLIAALLLREDDIALYEHGTLVLALDEAVAERFVRNPAHFAVKNTAATSPARRETVAKLADRLGYVSYTRPPTFLGVARRLFAQLRRLEPYAMQTQTVSATADAMRRAFRSASEPDRLLFKDLPTVFGLQPIPAEREVSCALVNEFVDALGATIEELEGSYPALLGIIEEEMASALFESPIELRRSLGVHAAGLLDSVLEPRLKSFVLAACRDELDDREWLENLAMVVADASAPKSWTDETVERFRLAATEVGGAFRRVSALLSERRALHDERGEALPIAITRIDGREGRMVLWTTDEERRIADDRVRQAVEELTAVYRSPEKAREVLLAALLDVSGSPQEALSSGGGEGRNGIAAERPGSVRTMRNG